MEVYRITNLINGKQYIGVTKYNFHKRYNCRKDWWNAPKVNRHLRASVKFHGPNNFKVEIIDKVTDIKELYELEKLYIKLFNTTSPFGYNLTYGGETGELTEEAKKRKSENRRGIPAWNKGLKGIYSLETRKRISEKNKGKVPPNKGKKTGPMPKETILKSAIGHYKKVKSINPKTGEQIVYESMLSVKAAGFHPQMVRNVCNKKQSFHKHLIWEWIDKKTQ